jgi:hypothetical protein
MNRALLIALTGLLMTIGCSQVNSPAEHRESREGIESAQKEADRPQSPAKLPKYHVTQKKTCQIASQTTACYSVSTDATSEEVLTAFTQHFRKQSGGVDNVVVTFFFDEPQANSSGRRFTFKIFFDEPQANTSGRGFAFNSKEAARKILSRSLPQERSLQDAYLNEEVRKAMQNDGIYVISIEDEIEQQACEGWGSNKSNILGRPPKQWNCPGF